MKKIVITGASSGFGKALAQIFSDNNIDIINISKSPSEFCSTNILIDFSKVKKLSEILKKNQDLLKNIDLIILNAGELGKIELGSDTSINRFLKSININLLSNKIIIDFFLNYQK
ncbi:MAG: hypothetical protein CBB97_01615, partial [Candidatus Endolissoclinum sp. TMED37]